MALPPFPLVSARLNSVVMVDEAHRSDHDVIDGFAPTRPGTGRDRADHQAG